MRLSGLVVLVLVVLGNLAIWSILNRPRTDVSWSGQIRGVSFSPYQKDDNPILGRNPTPEAIDKDLKLVAGKVAMVRTYTSLDGMEVIPELAKKYGLKVLAGAWIDTRLGKNEAEIRSLTTLARNNRNVERVIVGNEALHRGDVTLPQLVRYIRRVKEKVKAPVSTAEPWYVWIKHPELAKEVDYIAIHILPYWEGVPVDEAVDYLLTRYDEIQRAFPDKHIVITEVGWPSSGKTRMGADPSLVNQALFLRRFLNIARAKNIDYNIIEAFDQPWKSEIEWSVGAHWGLYDANRNEKFPMTGPVVEMKEWPKLAAAATIVGFVPLVWFLWRRREVKIGGRLFFAVMTQLAASVVIWTASVPVIRDFAPGPEIMWGVLVPGQIALLLVILISTFELTELTWAQSLKRQFAPLKNQPEGTRYPKVSLHLPCYNEPPQMVILTIDSLVKLDYPDFEILVIDNNTKDPAVWTPVEEHCATLGPKVRFFHLPSWPGFKAGALNFALSQTDPEAQIIGVVDSDYIVDSDWLKALAPYFDDPKVGWVQAPQDHREWENDTFKEMINWEYAGFFHIGMVARNEYDAIIQHGTMTLIRREALEKAGKWGEGYICEDAELGLKFLENGYQSVYVNHNFGKGLTPDSFMGYKKQRYRWAYGAMQIMKGHWRSLLPWSKSTGLAFGQKFQFVAGWLPWVADSLFLIFTLASILWSVGLVTAPRYFDFPLVEFAVPTLFVFFYKLATHLFLYQMRVKCTVAQQIGSAVAGMGLTFIIGKAVLHGIFTKTIPFMRTPKMENKAAMLKGVLMAWEELALALGQWSAAGAVLYSYGTHDRDARLWALVLVVQSMPFLAALITSLISVTPALSLRKPSPQPAG